MSQSPKPLPGSVDPEKLNVGDMIEIVGGGLLMSGRPQASGWFRISAIWRRLRRVWADIHNETGTQTTMLSGRPMIGEIESNEWTPVEIRGVKVDSLSAVSPEADRPDQLQSKNRARVSKAKRGSSSADDGSPVEPAEPGPSARAAVAG